MAKPTAKGRQAVSDYRDAVVGLSRQLRESMARVADLSRENFALREELWRQWEFNHSEHCGGVLPHSKGSACYWPLPAVLQGKAGG
jgi:hypothetical protein